MKLRNKKTGEILDLIEIIKINGTSNEFYLRMSDNEGRTYREGFNSLAELNEEWEDYYDEPKEYWWIDCIGDIYNDTDDGFDSDKKCKQIGNYFETREEAEKAVEKLKAWKRLKDNGIKFNLDFVKNNINFTYRLDGTLHSSAEEMRIIFNDLKLLFGGKE